VAKTGDPKKADKKSASKPATKPAPKPAQTKTAKNPGAKSPPPAAKLASKPPAKPAKPVAAKAAAPRADGGEHSAQAEHMRALYEKLHGSAEQRANIPGQNLPGKKKGGFDPQQFRGHQRGFGGGGAMIRRTQGRGGGSGGGGSGGGGA
jgi:hypothetical protein